MPFHYKILLFHLQRQGHRSAAASNDGVTHSEVPEPALADHVGLDSFVEPDVSAHIWCSHLLHGKCLDLSECSRGTLLETHSMDALEC